MRISINTVCLLSILLIPKPGFCQDDLLNSFENQFDISKEKVSYKEYTTHSNEARQVVSALFLFYKEFISSQDVDACVFTPSCSVYAMESVKTYGLIEGIMSAFDRMTRCHSLGGEYYHIHPITHKYHDPVEPKN